MKVFFFLFIGLSLIFQQSYGEEKVVKEGDVKSWYYRYLETSSKEGIFAGWGNGNQFESIDEKNGSWLVTKPVTKLPQGVIVNYHVDVQAKKTKCVNAMCSLQIFIYNGTEELKIPDVGFPVDVSGRKKQQIYLFHNFKKLHDVTFTKNNEIERQSFNFSHGGSKLRIAIRARAIDGEFYNMKLYYYSCNEKLWNGVRLPLIYPSFGGFKRVAVNCTSNAVSKYNGSYFEALCWYNGTWNIGNDTKCFCRAGYEMSGGCKRCVKGYFKSKISNERCTLCPVRSTSNDTNTVCNCLEEKYRLKNETGVSRAPCYGFPSKVRNINVEEGDSRGTITLRWERPSKDGGLPRSLKYDVDCVDECELKFKPSKVNLTSTTVQVSGLIPGHKYNFIVFSKNKISGLYGNESSAFANKTYTLKRNSVKETTDVSSNHSNRNNIIIATSVAVFLSIMLIVLLVKYKRLKRASKLSTPVNIPLEDAETPQESQESLPIDEEEPGYETVSRVVREFYDDVNTNANNSEGLYEKIGEPSDAHRTSEYETTGENEIYEEPETSSQHPGYAELDKNRLEDRNTTDDSNYQKLVKRDSDYVIPAYERRKSSQSSGYAELDKNRLEGRNTMDDSNYQKLIKRDSDYVIPAHERRESYEDIKMGRNQPGYTELDQIKREAEDYPAYNKLHKPELTSGPACELGRENFIFDDSA